MTEITDLQLDALLTALTKISRAHSPAVPGLAVYGQDNARNLLRQCVRKWMESQTPEAHR